MPEIRVEALTGDRLKAHLPDLARLRIEVFREYPYLYEGSLEYEERYLQAFAASANTLIVGAFDAETLVGVSTAGPLPSQMEEVTSPFRERGLDLQRYFYFGESVLLRRFRGRGLGVRFFAEREAHALRCGAELATFCAVVRPSDHPARPSDYRPLDVFWQRRGFSSTPGLTCTLRWPELGERDETEKTMQFWTKILTQRGDLTSAATLEKRPQ